MPYAAYAASGRPYTEYVLAPPPASWQAKEAIKKAKEEQKKKDEDEAKKKKEEEEKEADIRKKVADEQKKSEEEMNKRVHEGVIDSLKKLGVRRTRSRSRDSSRAPLLERSSYSTRRNDCSTPQITYNQVGPREYTSSSSRHRSRRNSDSSSDNEPTYLVHKKNGSTKWKTKRQIERDYRHGRWITLPDGSRQWVCG